MMWKMISTLTDEIKGINYIDIYPINVIKNALLIKLYKKTRPKTKIN